MKTLQKFNTAHASVHNHFSQEHPLVSREVYKERRSAALAEWQSVMCARLETSWRWIDSTRRSGATEVNMFQYLDARGRASRREVKRAAPKKREAAFERDRPISASTTPTIPTQ
jgi:hypothetical protein